MAISPTCLRRSDRQMNVSWNQPNAPASRIVSGAAMSSGMSAITLSAYPTRAPKVTSSPWEKFVRPVVPNTSDSPIAARARMRPKRRPDTANWGARFQLIRSK